MKGQWALYKVMKRHINKFRYASNIILAVFVSVLCFAQAVSSAPITDASHSDSFTIAESYLPTDGAYIIKNLASGKYLSVERYESKDEQEEMSYAVLSEASGEDTVFSITMQSDYSFLVNAESVGKHLFISSDEDSPLLPFKETDGITSRFSFMRLDDGSFFISPISTDDCNLVLCEDEEGRLSLSAFLGEANQCWIMEKLPVISIKMNRDTLSLTVGRSSILTAITYPTVPDEAIVYTSSDESVAVVNDQGLVTAVENGTTVITATAGSISAECTVTVSRVTASTFYSQHNTTGGGGWDGSALQSLRFAGKLFARDGFNQTTDWMDEGCLNCCFAMILKNLGATLDSGYDFRTDSTDNLEPDPYTVALANSGNYGPTNGKARLYGNPVAMDVPRMISRFSAGGSPLIATHQSGGNPQKIKEALDEHPEGVIVEVYKSEEYRHFLLFTECVNPQDDPKNYNFIVCDPSAFDREYGDHVLFTESTSYLTIGYRYSHIRSIKTISILSEYGYVGSLRMDRVGDSRVK